MEETPRPTVLEVKAKNIPIRVKENPRWIASTFVWKINKQSVGKGDKPPYQWNGFDSCKVSHDWFAPPKERREIMMLKMKK